MHGFSISFAYPWLLLLLIPAAVFTVLPYFLLPKRHRRTRNRIISMILHGVTMLLAIFALSGMTFEYRVHNDENEVILLVDVSDTEEVAAERRDAFLEDVIAESTYDGYKIGIVTFGFDQRYVVPFTYDTDAMLEQYYEAEKPDTTATDIAAALRYATTLFQNPETGKIVLISDGRQTDENALSVARSIAAQGIRVDTVNISEELKTDGLRVTNVLFPEYHVNLNEDCAISVELVSQVSDRTATVQISDNGVTNADTDVRQVDLIMGTQLVTFNKSFREQGVHEIVVSASVSEDSLEENNRYCAFFRIELYTHVLILEQAEGQSEELVGILKDGDVVYDTEVINIKNEPEKVPATVDGLRKYDQVILNNIANADLPAGFDEILYNYVYTYGGGLFTTGGSDGENNAHSYNRKDLVNTLYQQMLPVQAINYTPPIGVEIVIDVSGSMDGEKLDAAKEGAIQCLDVLNDRDYVGIITLSTTYGAVLQPTRRTQDSIIKEAIRSVESSGSTSYSNAIQRAGEALKSLKQVDRRHIIIVSDGEPTEPEDSYLPIAEKFYEENEITLSVVLIGARNSSRVDKLTAAAGGKTYDGTDLNRLGEIMQTDLLAKEIEESEAVEFHPIITNPLSNLAQGLEHEDFEEEDEGGSSVTRWRLKATLGGFYGTRARASAETVLTGEYEVPIYAQWKFGNGMVGSFMCDVYGEWSSNFINDANGKRFLRNVVANLMPTEDIRVQDITLNLRGENYINQLGISTQLEDGETVEGEICLPGAGGETVSLTSAEETVRDDVYVTTFLSGANRYSRCNFVVKTSGLYRIEIRKRNAAGEVVATAEIYKAFSYSSEYFKEEETEGSADGAILLTSLAERGGGKTIAEDEPFNIFTRFVTELNRVYDPRIAFMITALVLFLLDIAVRKFKFKWIHEIVREHKEKKAGKE